MKLTHRYVLTLLVFCAPQAYSQISLNPVPERSVGTPGLTVESVTPNLVEGREMFAPQAVAIDNSVSPPILYVSDYVNNRVLAWRNANTFTNGQKADLAIGQPDLLTTFPEGPGTSTSTYTTGLTRPSGLAVDSSGNLYVADGGNNRVLRYPHPFLQTGQFPIPDLFIGQTSISGHNANSPNGAVNPQGIFLNTGSLVSSLAIDSTGNLWMVDIGNVRVLRFKASDLAAGGGGLSADLVLGQADLTHVQPGLSTGDSTAFQKLGQFIQPTALAFDPNGNLFVADYNRALVFTPPFTSAMNASTHILGIFPPSFVFPTVLADKQALFDKSGIFGPSAFFFPTGSITGVGVLDASYNRIVIFDSFDKWPADNTPPKATIILGQDNVCTQSPNQTCKAANNGNPQSASLTFAAPAGAAYSGTHLYVADSGNNRVLDLPQGATTFGPAARVLGQDSFTSNAPNLIEGREFQFQGPLGTDSGIAIDVSSGTPHLYVADPYNNRVLGFKDVRKFQNGGANRADVVLGQPDFATNLINYPSGDPNKPTNSSLYHPIGILVDGQGNVYVADSLNSRVLRFAAPFAYNGASPEPADLVLGQLTFTSKITDPTAATMSRPYGLAFSPSCNALSQPCAPPNGLLVSDVSDNRVLYIPTTANGTFTAQTDNGKAATIVFGQTDFNSIGSGTSRAAMSAPHHLSSDTSGYVYVADTGNNRVLIFPDPHSSTTPASGETAPAVIGSLSAPQGVYASPVTGEIWVANTGNGNYLRYQDYQSVLLGLGSISIISDCDHDPVNPNFCKANGFSYPTLAAIQDQYGDLVVADAAHRVTFYFPGLNPRNAASLLTLANRPLAPGTIGTLFPCDNCSGTQFVAPATPFSSYPVPPVLADIQVLVDGTPAPLYYVSGNQINFIMPNSARISGFADLQVVQYSTGQVLGATEIPMYSVAPGAFPYPGGQTGATVYAAAINADNTINDAAHPALRGQYVSLYLTGQGNIPGGPADGVPASSAFQGQYTPTVLLNGQDVNGPAYGESGTQHILYSGINQYPGMWQINVIIPKTVVTSAGVWFAVIANGLANWDSASGFKTYIYVK